MGQGRGVRCFLLCLFVCFSTLGISEASGPVLQGTSERARQAKYFTVEITTDTADVFIPDPSACVGTGFIVSLSEDKGFIFTNKHVVENGPFDARRVQVSFNLEDQTSKSEQIDAEVVFESKLFDFAVVKFDPRKLKKAKSHLTVAQLPEASEFLSLVEAGRSVMAYGNPLSSRNNATFGTVSGYSFGKDWSISKRTFWGQDSFVNTDTAINPGNSGGPLVDIETGKVVGINTAIIQGANNHGFVTPILPLIEEWRHVQSSRRGPSERVLLAEFDPISLEKAQLEPGLMSLIQKDMPEYANIFESVLSVVRGDACGLLPGDIVLRVAGEPVGDQMEKLNWLLETSTGKSIPFTVLREGKKVEIPVEVKTRRLDAKALRNRYLMASGVVFQELEDAARFILFDGKKGVIVTRVIPLSIGDQMTRFRSGVIVTEVVANGKRSRVENLNDLETVLRSAPEGSYVRMLSHHPITIEGTALNLEGHPVIARSPDVEVFPVDKVVSSEELPLRTLKAEFDFSGKDLNSRLIQTRIDGLCKARLFQLANVGTKAKQ